MKYKTLDIGGALLDNCQLENYLKKLASDQILKQKSDRKTYPIPRLEENLKFISEIYSVLNNDVKQKIPIHPAGEWILDNFYIIEKNAKTIIKSFNKKKYTGLIGISNGLNKGFARAYVLAKEIVSYTDGKITGDSLENYLQAYQTKKTLSMEELWTIPIFIQITLIEKIRGICEKIYLSQIQKRKVDNIISRLLDMNECEKYSSSYKIKYRDYNQSKYPFVEYMSYRLKMYGSKAYSYIEILKNEVNKTGTTILECINREHYDIATKKISIGNCITSINLLNRLNYTEIFNKTNGVEKVLTNDPCGVYEKMDYKTKEYYRSAIEQISKKTKISELYIANMCVQMANEKYNLAYSNLDNKDDVDEKNAAIGKNKISLKNKKEMHVGYYLIGKGRNELYEKLLGKKTNEWTQKRKVVFYITCEFALTIVLALILGGYTYFKLGNVWAAIVIFLFSIIPIKNIVVKTIQYVAGKTVKPKLIPKMDFYNGIPEEYATMVVIPTIVSDENKVIEMMRKLEVYYMANKSDNLYFTLLGDCTSENIKEVEVDEKIANIGIKECDRLNKKYCSNGMPIFNFVYRERLWNNSEECYLGWERKRGLLNQFNEYILGNSQNCFFCNSFELLGERRIPKIKYIITLDADTNLVLNTAFELVGAMAHILNAPVLDENKNIVVDGYGIMQPRVGIGLVEANKSVFTKIYSGLAGTDSYTNAISDFYQDNFGEGIFTGKGIFDIKVFSKVMKNEIPENTVLSHDLLEGCYLRCGLVSDILLMDGFPTSYSSYKVRMSRWIRGDYQILSWINNKKISCLSKYKILDNITRSLVEVCAIVLIIINLFVRKNIILITALTTIVVPYIFDFLNKVLFKKNGEFNQKKYSKEINGYNAIFYKFLIDISLIPDKAVTAAKSMVKAMYRMLVSKKHMLEWTTAEEAEKLSKQGILVYLKSMIFSIVMGLIVIVLGVISSYIFYEIVGILWIMSPLIQSFISKTVNNKDKYKELNEAEKQYVIDIARKTWNFFKEYLNEKTNYLPPDNYQEDRKEKIVYRTSPTNIGLAMLSVVASYDLGFESKEFVLDLIEKMILSIEKLPKWNGHLYNWYNIDNLTVLSPRYVSSVDSGNFVGYLYVLKQFFINECKDYENSTKLIEIIDKLIDNTDFSKLYDEKTGLFSIGYNIEENKITDSFYDLVASEARQTSLVAIAKKDVTAKHWKNLSRTLTVINRYKGLISWSGTSFEYLMPGIIIKRYPGSLLDESCRFMIMSQIEYANKLGIDWGISEAAFNLKDFNGNYQYKAFGIPWLGLKRGLADEMVASSYGSILAINDKPVDVIKNLKNLESKGMLNKYGFYESIDYTPARVKQDENCAVVKTYMAHHQGLILLSINNLINSNINQIRFFQNPEIEAIDILLQERMPDNVIITKEKKEKVEKIKYTNYNYYSEHTFGKGEFNINEYNLIQNNNYMVLIDKNGNGYSKYYDKIINRYKKTDNCDEGIHFFIKNTKSNNVWSTTNLSLLKKDEDYEVTFCQDKSKFSKVINDIKSNMFVTVAPEDPVEIRKLELKNIGNNDEVLEISSVFEPVLSSALQDYAHKAFNNLFLSFEMCDGIIIAKRKFVNQQDELYMAATMLCEENFESNVEFELDKNELCGRQNFNVPKLIQESKPFSSKIKNTTNPIISFRKSVEIKAGENKNIVLLIGVSKSKKEAIENVKKYANAESIERAINLSKAQSEAKIQYLGIEGSAVELYRRILSNCITSYKMQDITINENDVYSTSELWKFGISGDNLIILLHIKDVSEIDSVKTILGAFEYFKTQNFPLDIVIVNDEKESYENFVREAINKVISDYKIYSTAQNGKIFVLSNISEEDKKLLNVRSNLVLSGDNIEFQLDNLDYQYEKKIKKIGEKEKNNLIDAFNQEDYLEAPINMEKLQFYNEYGGFSEDGKEYIVDINKNKKLPFVWCNVLANPNFGTVMSESMGGYTWYKNSRLNRITALFNDAVQDVPSEVIYVQDTDPNASWSEAVSPKPVNNDYDVKYRFGYNTYLHNCNGIEQEIETFVPVQDSEKVYIIHLNNTKTCRKRIKVVYYIKLVMDEDEIKSCKYVDLKYSENSNIIIARNIINDEFKNYFFVSSSEKIKSYTGLNEEFFGDGNISNPDGVYVSSFSNSNSINNDSRLALNMEVELEALERKDISIVIGAEDSIINCKNMAYKYSKLDNCYAELDIVKKYWNDILSRLIIETPDKSMNLLVNGWLMYQTISSRLFARSGFYQSGGASGFRDQLQDSMSVKYINAEYTKQQILKHSKHQFIEGDVLHWWHDETKRGIRTNFSDDLLWLAFVTHDYVNFTGDYNILDIETNYLESKTLPDGMDEKYDIYEESETKESIYMHCIRAIKKACNFGEHGLPKIGSGDWNDGFSNVGNKGIGESVWLGFFLYDILVKFIDICSYKNDTKNAELFNNIANKLKKNLNNDAWDGRWYKRAFCDDGTVLGSIHNQECRIDNIAQSWSVISNAGDNDKKYIALESMENHLVDKYNGIIKLLDPPFEKSNLNPGYIKAYLPGTRENGGQYTHAAIWSIIAETLLGFSNKAMDYYRMINPIEHTKTRALCDKYRAEPFVIAADVYGSGNLSGVGGWTWYTGSSSWYYICAIKYILGLEIKNGMLTINPCVPREWREYKIKYKYGESIYNIAVRKEVFENNGVKKIVLNGNEIKEDFIRLTTDGSINEVLVLI